MEILIIRLGLPEFHHLVKGPLATKAETTATAESCDGNNSNDYTDNAAD